jgi:hypothetical protein
MLKWVRSQAVLPMVWVTGWFFSISDQAEIIYQNTGAPSYIAYDDGETGQTVIPGGTNRLVTRMSVELEAKLQPGSQAVAMVRFYSNRLEGDDLRARIGWPDEPLYESGAIPIPAGMEENNYRGALIVSNINVRVPEFFT